MMTKFMNKQRGLLAAIMALVMVFAGAAFVAAEVDAENTETVDVIHDELMEGDVVTLTDAEGNISYSSSLTAAMEEAAKSAGSIVTLLDNIEMTAEAGTSYGKAGVVINAGVTLDGNNHKLTISGADGTWDCAIGARGGTIENLTIGGAFRGIFIVDNTADITIDNCIIDNVCYPVHSDEPSNFNLIVKNTTLNGWTSFAAGFKTISFINCIFGEGTGDYQYAYCRPYQNTTFEGCDFATGFEMDLRYAAITLIDCKIDGVAGNQEAVFGGDAVAKSPADGGFKYYYNLQSALNAEEEVILMENVESGNYNLLNTIIVPFGVTITATFTTPAGDSVALDGVKAGSSGIVISVGSISIVGSVDEGTTTLSGDIELSGSFEDIIIDNTNPGTTITVSVDGVELNGDMTFTSENLVTIKAVGDITGTGTIVNNKAGETPTEESIVTIEKSTGSDININTAIEAPTEVTDIVADVEDADFNLVDQAAADELEALMANSTLMNVDKNIVISNGVTLEIPAHITINMGANNIVVGSKIVTTGADVAELTIYGHVNGTGTIDVYGSLFLDAADVRMSVDVHEDDGAYVSIVNPKKMTVTGDSTADLGVGYGNTLVLKDLEVPAGKYIEAYGTVIIEGTVTVQSNNGFHIYKGGDAQIDGALIIEGTATIDGEVVVNGSVKVFNTDGKAKFTVGQSGEVDVLGTMEVLKGKTKDTFNTLDIDSQKFNVEGTLTVTGKLEGNVNDMGTIVFNGVAGTEAKITVFDGVTLTVASVTNTLIVTDVGIIDETELTGLNYAISASETITLKDVKGITISVAVKETVKEVEKTTGTGNDAETETVKYRFYVATMTVSGSVVDTDKVKADSKVAIVNNSIWDSETTLGTDVSVEFPRISKSNVIVEDITIGEGVALEFNAEKVSVDGTVSVVAKNSSIETKKDVTVNGTIIVGDAEGIDSEPDVLKINGAHYEVQSADMTETTCYYTTFQNALAATGIYENSIDVLGNVDIKTAVDVPAGIEVIMASESTMNIKTDGKVTVAADALLNADASKNIIVDGMLVIMDKEYGLDGEEKVKYQVKTETEGSITYCGLILAIKNAQAGDVIEIVGTDAVIDESVTIPEGVTLLVPAKSALTIGDEEGDKVTLTVDGTLKVTGGVVDVEGNEDVTKIVINGVVAINGDMDKVGTDYAEVVAVSDDYVVFEMKVDGKYVTVMSNIAYAAENATYGVVAVIGDVTGGDVTFTEAEKASKPLQVLVYGSTLTVSSITLVNSEIFVWDVYGVDENDDPIFVSSSTFTGVIKAASASGVASIDASKSGEFSIESTFEEDVDGKTDLMLVTGIPYGEFSIVSGTITVDEILVLLNSSIDDVSYNASVESEATVVVPEGTIFETGAQISEDKYVVIAGKIVVEAGAEVYIYAAIISGTISIENNATATVGLYTTVIGQVIVAEKTEKDVSGVLIIEDVLYVGFEPSIGASGSITGTINTSSENGIVVAFPGSDLSGALIDVNESTSQSEAESTEFYINGQLYMTVYTADDVTVDEVQQAILTIEIPGLDSEPLTVNDNLGNKMKWFADEAMKVDALNERIGAVEKVYAKLETSEVKATISAGVGLQIYIDGLIADSFYDSDEKAYLLTVGTHTVSIETLSGYDGSNATITVNGKAVSNGGSFTIDVDEEIVIIASGAVPAQSGAVIVDNADEGMSLTDILLIVLVVLIVIMAIIVALRMMRS